ncbi:hypothetical protein BDR26DRAFT_862281 [Obelidium mucronatum]|nr:hypothetical protein BDR26DRAFT_862281 [Obelidium mucronatum]
MPAQTTATQPTTPTTRRIMRELRELEASPLPGITVHVNDNDMTSLCVKMVPQEGAYEGLPLHLKADLSGYPSGSPKVVLNTPMKHPNVFPGWEEGGAYICCDILKGKLVTDSQGRVSGYSPAYSLGTILLQLMSFFSAKNIEQDYEGMRTNNAGNSQRGNLARIINQYSCKCCGYVGSRLVAIEYVQNSPPSSPASSTAGSTALEMRSRCQCKIVHTCGRFKNSGDKTPMHAPNLSIKYTMKEAPVDETAVETQKRASLAAATLGALPIELILEIASHMSMEDLIKLGRSSADFAQIIQNFNLITKHDQKCFYYKTNTQESTLGVGVWVASAGRNRDMKPVDFDLLSHEAFVNEKVRQTVWGQSFTHFLPLALTPEHFEKALPLLRSTLMELDFGRGAVRSFSPDIALHVLSKLMNLMVVDLMKTCDADSTFTQSLAPKYEYINGRYEMVVPVPAKTKLIASEKALIGYSQLLHLLLSYCNRYPDLVTYAENRLATFLVNKNSRGKRECPNLGEFIILLFCQDKYTWKQLAVPIFREASIRNVVWMLDPKHGNKPSLCLVEGAQVSDFRLKETFSAQQTSLRLLMFQVLFMRRLGISSKSSSELLAELNGSYGYPHPSLATKIVQDIKGIYKVDSFDAFLSCIEIPVPSKAYFCDLLKESISLSLKRKYHECRYSWDQLKVLRMEADPSYPQSQQLKQNVGEFQRNLSFFKF